MSRTAGLLLAAAIVWIATARQPAHSQESAAALSDVSARLADAAWLESFARDFVADQVKTKGAVGAATVAVKDGRVLFATVHGYANRETQTPIDPEKTLFWLASMSKTFVGTVAMRLVDRGVLDLDAPIATYVPEVKLDGAGFRPITLRHLLTHSSGLTEQTNAGAAWDVAHYRPLSVYVPREVPGWREEPGVIPSYCNYCMALAGYVVERVMKKPYFQVLQEEVFAPLGMNACFAVPDNPAAAACKDRLITPYFAGKDGKYLPVDVFGSPAYLRMPSPAGFIGASAPSIARYMIMHIDDGAIDGQQFLTPASSRAMKQTQFRAHPLIPGFGISFKEGQLGPLRYVGHTGSFRGEYNMMIMLPEQRFGLWLSITGTTSAVQQAWIDALETALFGKTSTGSPAPASGPAVAADVQRLAEAEAGTYTIFRFLENTPITIIWKLFGQIHVTTAEDTVTIRIPSYYLGGGTVTYHRVSAGLYERRDVGGGGIADKLVRYLVFKRTTGDSHLYFSTTAQDDPFTARKIGWISTSQGMFAQVGVVLILSLLFVLRLLGAVVRPAWRASFSLAWAMSGVFGLASLGFAAWFAYGMAHASSDWDILYGFEYLGIQHAFALPFVALAAAAVALAAWLRPGTLHRTGDRLGLAGLIVAAATLAYFCADNAIFSWYPAHAVGP
jgi:CubicO group peptidase (beta-lactamase class C family)